MTGKQPSKSGQGRGHNLQNGPGKGRPKGVPNKVTKALKDMILGALDGAGGQAYLEQQAHENPKAFLSLLGRTLPMTIQGGDGTKDGEPVRLVINLVGGPKS